MPNFHLTLAVGGCQRECGHWSWIPGGLPPRVDGSARSLVMKRIWISHIAIRLQTSLTMSLFLQIQCKRSNECAANALLWIVGWRSFIEKMLAKGRLNILDILHTALHCLLLRMAFYLCIEAHSSATATTASFPITSTCASQNAECIIHFSPFLVLSISFALAAFVSLIYSNRGHIDKCKHQIDTVVLHIHAQCARHRNKTKQNTNKKNSCYLLFAIFLFIME